MESNTENCDAGVTQDLLLAQLIIVVMSNSQVTFCTKANRLVGWVAPQKESIGGGNNSELFDSSPDVSKYFPKI